MIDEQINNIHEIAMDKAIEESRYNLSNKYNNGGPFGAVIVKNGEIIVTAHNNVIESKDCTAHAEINAIRKACQKLNTHDLKDCVLYTSAQPCPMCLSAIIWSNIKEVYYANTKEDANYIGFRDDIIYKYLKGENDDLLNMHHIDCKEAIQVFEEYKKIDGRIIY